MILYFLLIRIAALLGHEKARMLVKGQKEAQAALSRQLPALRGAIWVHAASVGEFEQARPLIERLRECSADRIQNTDRYADRTPIVVTFFSPSGYETRKHYDQADAVLYLPFATRRNAKRFLEALQPKMAIFVKYEFWPAYLKELRQRAIPTYCISAIFRPTQRFFHWYGRASLGLLRCFTHIYVQNEASRRLLTEHGIAACSVTGDTRFDRVKQIASADRAQNTNRLMPIAQFAEGCERVIVAGSTWPEDERLLEAYLRLLPEGKITKLILVPHEIDEVHLHYIFNLFQGRMVRYSRATPTALLHARVLVIDTIGLLSSIYRFGQVAYVGGGFGEGIHNTIEPAVYGMPVIFGPNYHHFREAQGLIDAGAARSIKNYKELESAIEDAFGRHEEMGARAAGYVQSELGATEKIYAELFGN